MNIMRILNPKITLYFVLILLYSILLITIKPQEPAVFFLWILSVLLIVVKMRFKLEIKYFFIDVLFWLVIIVFFESSFILILPSFVILLYYGKLWSIFPVMLFWFSFIGFDVETLLIISYAFVSGGTLHLWKTTEETAIQNTNHYRETIYLLDKEQQKLLENQHEIAQLSILSERDRIAQKLHDDLGHDLTGALLALRALQTKHPELIKDSSFEAINSRLESSVENLKETVVNTRSEQSYGLEDFKNLISSFTYASIEYQQNGNLLKLNATHWHILLSVLKEALTNIQKHSKAKQVTVNFLVEDPVVRLLIKNDGVTSYPKGTGSGLKYMRRRIESLGGVLSLRKDYHFTLICVLPLTLEVGE